MQLFAWSNDAWNIHTCSHLAVYFTLANSNGLFTPLYCRSVWCVAVIHWEKYPKAPSQCTCIAGHCIALPCIVVCGTHKLKGEVWAFKKHTYILASMLYICVMLQLSHVKMENWPLITHCHCQSRSLLFSSNAHWNDRLEGGRGSWLWVSAEHWKVKPAVNQAARLIPTILSGSCPSMALLCPISCCWITVEQVSALLWPPREVQPKKLWLCFSFKAGAIFDPLVWVGSPFT